MGDQDKDNSHLTRRAFVGWAGSGAVVVTLAGLVRFVDHEEHFARPPGARPEPEFLALCIRCDKCRDACRYAEIVPVQITESLVSFGTPKLVSGSWCPRCGRCIPVCPTGALANNR